MLLRPLRCAREVTAGRVRAISRRRAAVNSHAALIDSPRLRPIVANAKPPRSETATQIRIFRIRGIRGVAGGERAECYSSVQVP